MKTEIRNAIGDGGEIIEGKVTLDYLEFQCNEEQLIKAQKNIGRAPVWMDVQGRREEIMTVRMMYPEGQPPIADPIPEMQDEAPQEPTE